MEQQITIHLSELMQGSTYDDDVQDLVDLLRDDVPQQDDDIVIAIHNDVQQFMENIAYRLETGKDMDAI